MAFVLARPAGPRRSTRRPELAPYLFVLPSLVLLGLWAYYQLLATVWLSFFSGILVGGGKDFVGLRNYTAVLATPEFQVSLVNTFKYIVGMVPLAVALPLGVALLAAELR